LRQHEIENLSEDGEDSKDGKGYKIFGGVKIYDDDDEK
jgi:hypothetical protein